MSKPDKFDFSGYATKANTLCSDGRTIMPGAFKHQNSSRVPLVWQHDHNSPSNILGHAILENRADGVYAYGVFNDTQSAKDAKKLIQHGDIVAMSVFANKLVEREKIVHGGHIREVSLVLSGANPGALIDNITFAHGDELDIIEDEAIIYSGESITHEDTTEEKEESNMATKSMAHSGEKTVGDVFESFSDEQKQVVYALMADLMGDSNAQHSEGDMNSMKHNLFDGGEAEQGPTLTHDEMKAIFADAQKGGSLRDAFMAHAGTYGIDNIDYLFPDAKAVADRPTFISRDMAWVNVLMSGTKHTPFSRIKSLAADITADEARARGYVKGNLKKEEVFALLKRVTTPTTIYKKQKLDRDDVIDIVDFDVVAWIKGEMRLMLDEEIARAVLVGDGRDVASEDKINPLNIRPIYSDDAMYAHRVELPSNTTVLGFTEEIIRARKDYKGTGNPTMFVPTGVLTDMLLLKDTLNRRLYNTQSELENALRVSKIVEVPVMEGVSRETNDPTPVTYNLKAILVNPVDYVIGADKGGAINFFDDFDIDYNQQKYLLETRISGALVNPKTALVIEQAASGG